jgi:hypothetical protein
MEAILSREQAYLEVVEGWLRDNRGIVFTEGAVDDLCDRIAANNERLRAILRDVWIDGMQDGLPDSIRNRIDDEVGDECRAVIVHGVGTS